jgi:hypothetical protein
MILENNTMMLVKKYKVKYLLIERPNNDQWYEASIRSFAEKLWNYNFQNATIAFVCSTSEGTFLKVWQLRA